jgi:hypothetical protein
MGETGMGRHSRICLIAIAMILAGAAPVRADDLTVSDTLTLQNYWDQNTFIIFRSTDITDGEHICSSNTSNPCTVEKGYSSIPKNIGHVLCLSNQYKVSISNSCSTLLNTGSNDGCEKNLAKNYCQGAQNIYPICNWRTTADASTPAKWSWTVTYNNAGSYIIDCTHSGYQGTQQ